MANSGFLGLRFGGKDIDHEKGIAVIGLGRFGRALAEELINQGIEVLGVDINEDVVQDAAGTMTHVVRGDATKPEVLAALGIAELPKVVVAIGAKLEASILVCSALLRIENGPEVWAKASTAAQAEILEQMGITHIFRPDAEMGRKAAHVVARSLNDYVDLGYGFALLSTQTPEKLAGMSLLESGLRRKFGITVIAVRRGCVWEAANSETILEADDTILVVGPAADLEEMYR